MTAVEGINIAYPPMAMLVVVMPDVWTSGWNAGSG